MRMSRMRSPLGNFLSGGRLCHWWVVLRWMDQGTLVDVSATLLLGNVSLPQGLSCMPHCLVSSHVCCVDVGEDKPQGS